MGHSNSRPLLVEKYGEAKAEAILNLKNYYQNLVIRYRTQQGLVDIIPDDVEKLCAHIHGVWAGRMLPILKKDRECLILEYSDLKPEIQFLDFKELCWAWDFCYDREAYPFGFRNYATNKNWSMSDVGQWII